MLVCGILNQPQDVWLEILTKKYKCPLVVIFQWYHSMISGSPKAKIVLLKALKETLTLPATDPQSNCENPESN